MSVLVVDDDKRLLSLLEKYLIQEGFDVKTALDTTSARKILYDFDIEVIILDVMLQQEDGFSFLKTLDQDSPPVLLLTARDSLDDKVKGFENGACDYLTKPFEPKELSLRINAILKKRYISKIHLGEFIFDEQKAELYKNDEHIKLSSTEKILLKVLIQNQKNTCSRENLANNFCNGVSLRTIDMQIARLRKKIDDNKEPFIIQTIRHVGYALFPRDSKK